jgi:hypothetical protein
MDLASARYAEKQNYPNGWPSPKRTGFPGCVPLPSFPLRLLSPPFCWRPLRARTRMGIRNRNSPRDWRARVPGSLEVFFPDNPFPHTLESSTELGYNVWPVLLGFGWFNAKQHFQIQLGTYAAFVECRSVRKIPVIL